MSLENDVTSALVDGLVKLIEQGKRRDYWCSSRATADALITLDLCLPTGQFIHLQGDARKHLLAESDLVDGRRNWNGEIWDTAVAALALRNLRANEYKTATLQSRDWLLSKYLKSHYWNHEQWETLWALIALSRLPEPPQNCDFSAAIEWLTEAIIGEPTSRMLMNWSNTALFILFTNTNCWEYSEGLKERVAEEKQKCLETILATPLDEDGAVEVLWTPEGWSNGLVLWALSEAQHRMPDEAAANKIVKWCQTRISDGSLVDEDLAFVCIGLYHYLRWIYLQDASLKEAQLKFELCEQVKMAVPDKPVALTKHTHPGYWSMHIRRRSARFAVYIVIALVLSGATLYFDDKRGWSSLIALIPLLLSLIVGFADFRQLLPWSKAESETFAETEPGE